MKGSKVNVYWRLVSECKLNMDNIAMPSELRVAKYAEARIKEIQALTQVLGRFISVHVICFIRNFIKND